VIQYLSWVQKVKETQQDNNNEMCGKHSCEFLSFRSGAGEVWSPFFWDVALYSWLLVPDVWTQPSRLIFKDQNVEVVKLWHCKNHSLTYVTDFCNIFCFCKNWHPKNKLLQITAAKCWFRHFYDMRNFLSTAATVCDHERETAESTALPFHIPGFDETTFTTDLPQAMVSLRQAM
jgi:hypothetical protein